MINFQQKEGGVLFILIFILAFSFVTSINNKINKVSSDNQDSYSFDKKGSLVFIGFFILAIILNKVITYEKYERVMLISLGIYFLIVVFVTIIINQIRISKINAKRESIDEIYRVIGTELNLYKNKVKKEFDYNDIPFKLEYEKGELSRIEIEIIEDSNFADAKVMYAVKKLNDNFTHRRWVSNVDFPERKCTFIGQRLPPKLANYPGSDLRPWNWIPLGLGGNGEIGWNLGAKNKEMGRSQFVYENGEIAKNVDTPRAPQAMTLGATGGGKAIWIDQDITS